MSDIESDRDEQSSQEESSVAKSPGKSYDVTAKSDEEKSERSYSDEPDSVDESPKELVEAAEKITGEKNARPEKSEVEKSPKKVSDAAETFKEDSTTPPKKSPKARKITHEGKIKKPMVADDDKSCSKILKVSLKRIPSSTTRSNLNDEPYRGLFYEPLIQTGSRERKKIDRLEIKFTESKEKSGSVFEDGSGDKLGDSPQILQNLSKLRSDDFKILHKILFNRYGTANEIKKNIRKFNGFNFDENSEEYKRKRASADKLSFTDVQLACQYLDLESSDSREILVDRLFEFLMNPKITPQKETKQHEKSHRKSSKRGSESRTGGGKKKIRYNEDSSENENSEDEEEKASEKSNSEQNENVSSSEEFVPSKKSGKKSKIVSEDNDSGSEDGYKPSTNKSRSKTTPAKKRHVIAKDSDDDNVSGSKEQESKSRRTAAKKKPVIDISSDDEDDDVDQSGSEDEKPSRSTVRRPGRLSARKKPNLKESDDEIASGSDVVEYKLGEKKSRYGRTASKRKAESYKEDSDGSEDEKRQKLTVQKALNSKSSSKEDREDEDFKCPSPVEGDEPSSDEGYEVEVVKKKESSKSNSTEKDVEHPKKVKDSADAESDSEHDDKDEGKRNNLPVNDACRLSDDDFKPEKSADKKSHHKIHKQQTKNKHLKSPRKKPVNEDAENKRKADGITESKERKKSRDSKRKNISDDSDDEPLIKRKKDVIPPTDEELKKVIRDLLVDADLEQVTMKSVCKDVYAKYPEFDLTDRKDFIKSTVRMIIS